MDGSFLTGDRIDSRRVPHVTDQVPDFLSHFPPFGSISERWHGAQALMPVRAPDVEGTGWP